MVGSGWPGTGDERRARRARRPMSAICATPVRPWYSRRARVSVRIGVLPSTWMIATTRRGSSGSRLISVTSPTRMPLNSTTRALGQAGDRAGEHDADGLARLAPVAAGEPVDEAEGRRDHRQGEQADQGVIGTRFHRLTLKPRRP